MPKSSQLRVFLCHSSNDKPAVRELYGRLKSEGWIDPWLDEEKLLPGQDWDLEIEKAVEAGDAVIVFLSNNSVSKEGYVQRELRFVLRLADFKPEGTVFVIPLRLDDCPMPRRLSMWQYVDYFPKDRKEWAYERLLGSLKVRARKLEISTVNPAKERARREAEDKAKKKEEHERKELEEKARKEKEAADKAAKEKAERETAEKAGQERIERKRLEREEKVRKEKKEPVKKEPEIRHESPSPARGGGDRGGGSKPAWLPYAIGAGVLVACIAVFGIGSFIQNALSPDSPTATKRSPTLAPATSTEIVSIVIPTNTHLTSNTPEFSNSTHPPSTEIPTDWVDGDTLENEIDGSTLVYISEGCFQMGTNKSELINDRETPPHEVCLDAYWIQQTEVPIEQFRRFVEDTNYRTIAEKQGNAYVFSGEDWYQDSSANWENPMGSYGSSVGDKYPAAQITWDDAVEYCDWANMRLPTEAEWEHAARGATNTLYPWGQNWPGHPADYLNYCDWNCPGVDKDFDVNDGYERSAPVASYLPNDYGLYDMAGNLWEWVEDWYDSNYYTSSPRNNPTGPSSGSGRILRGGSWDFGSGAARSTYRKYRVSGVPWETDGFRCARSASE